MRTECGIEVPLSIDWEIENLLFSCCPFVPKINICFSPYIILLFLKDLFSPITLQKQFELKYHYHFWIRESVRNQPQVSSILYVPHETQLQRKKLVDSLYVSFSLACSCWFSHNDHQDGGSVTERNTSH